MPNDQSGPDVATRGGASLNAPLADLLAESRALRGDVRESEEARQKAVRINLIILGLISAFVVIMGVISWQSYQVSRQLNETNQKMADCTTPGGQCYEIGRRRTAGAIEDVIRASVYMSQCARLYPGEVGPEYDRKLEACVNERLTKAATGRATTPTPTPTVSPSPTGGAK